jgi:2-C-methyl-D-erythritol 4-phosphate cytidylyltransferase
MNIGVILAAGKSSRFDSSIPKQLYQIDGKPMIQYSIDLLSKHLDKVIIVTNSECSDKITGNVIINDVDSRLESIKVALESIETCDNILIHDAARPYVTDKMILDLIESNIKNMHSQFYLPLVNGLAKSTPFGYQIPDRKDFIELCSPQITNFDIFKQIFRNYIEKGEECEVLPIVSRFEMKYNLIQSHYKYLRKITTIEDIY